MKTLGTTITISLLGLLVGCSGSGVSTTARDDMGMDDMGAADGADGADGGADGAGDDDDDDDDAAGDDDDDDAEGDDDDDDDAAEPVTLEGVWVSSGMDVAPLLVELTGAVEITATFTPDTFTVHTLDNQGQEVSQSGVYTAEPVGTDGLYAITLEQTTPQAITAEGIYQIDNTTNPPILRYEVVQTIPSVGAEPPTPDKGFGGTNLGDDLTQIFVRQ